MLRFVPKYRTAPWGGERFTEEFGRRLPEPKIGESWELVEAPFHHSVVATGPHEGSSIGELWRAGVLGGSGEGGFPFLLKWLDTHAMLSVQVHPDPAACERLGKGDPKEEAWYVAHNEPKATIYLGHYPGLDAATLSQAAKGGTVHKWLYETRPRAGDLLRVPAGTLHSIGPGFILLEVQQPSDTTYRVFDWDRTDRELHLEDACASVNFDSPGPQVASRDRTGAARFSMRLVKPGERLDGDSLRVLVGQSGGTALTTERGNASLEFGDVVVAERADGEIGVLSGTCVLVTEAAG